MSQKSKPGGEILKERDRVGSSWHWCSSLFRFTCSTCSPLLIVWFSPRYQVLVSKGWVAAVAANGKEIPRLGRNMPCRLGNWGVFGVSPYPHKQFGAINLFFLKKLIIMYFVAP